MKSIPLPESQLQEVLFELINRLFIDRRTMMLSANIWNLTARISNLRRLGVSIISHKISSTNKYKREIEYCQYSLENRKKAVEIYMKLKENQTGIL